MTIKCKAIFKKRIYTNGEDFSVYSAKLAAPCSEITLSSFKDFSVNGDFEIEKGDLETKPFTINVVKDLSGRYDNSYIMEGIDFSFPESPAEQWDFLANSMLVSKTRYRAIKTAFPGKKVLILDLITNDPSALTKVSGIGEKLSLQIHKKVVEEKDLGAIYQAFGKIKGLGPSVIKGIRKMGPDVQTSINRIKEDPFILLAIDRVGFLLADKVREYIGIPKTDRDRCLHGVKYFILDSFHSTGDTYANLNSEIYKLASQLEVNVELLISHVKEEAQKAQRDNKYGVKIFGNFITTVELFEAEQIISKRVKALVKENAEVTNSVDWNNRLKAETANMSAKLSDEQLDFINKVRTESILLLVGPGGSGKSWVTKLAVKLLEEASLKVNLVAPTARAANVMSTYVDKPASTIHREIYPLLMRGEEGGVLNSDVVIVDESSMVDSELMANLMKVSPNSRLIIIGDSFQLPSVGPGNVLYDLIHSLKVPMVEFTNIYRQSEGSNIINYAEALRRGTFSLDTWEDFIDAGDITFVNKSNPEEISDLAIDAYKGLIKEKTEEDIMVLSPVNKGLMGRQTLNRRIQEIVNGNTYLNTLTFGANSPEQIDFRVGDYITITKNNNEAKDVEGNTLAIINGDVGRLHSVKPSEVVCDLDGRLIPFIRSEVKANVDHFWATTIHKSQGGQAEDVVILIPKNSWGLSANMLYTAITRARKHCLIIGDFSSLNSASKRLENFNRKTILALNAQLKAKKTKE